MSSVSIANGSVPTEGPPTPSFPALRHPVGSSSSEGGHVQESGGSSDGQVARAKPAATRGRHAVEPDGSYTCISQWQSDGSSFGAAAPATPDRQPIPDRHISSTSSPDLKKGLWGSIGRRSRSKHAVGRVNAQRRLSLELDLSPPAPTLLPLRPPPRPHDAALPLRPAAPARRATDSSVASLAAAAAAAAAATAATTAAAADRKAGLVTTARYCNKISPAIFARMPLYERQLGETSSHGNDSATVSGQNDASAATSGHDSVSHFNAVQRPT